MGGATPGLEPIFLADLDRCEPREALSTVPKWRHWRVVSYEADGVSGAMICASEETAAPAVTYPLQASGWHTITVGLYRELEGNSFPGGDVGIEVKLTDDPTFTALVLRGEPAPPGGPVIEELTWKTADLTGLRMTFRQVTTQVGPGDHPSSFRCIPARLAYVKLTPLSSSEVAALHADRRRGDTRRLFAHNDGHGLMFYYRVTSPEKIYRDIEPYRHTDFARLYWECGAGDLMFYLGQTGKLPTCDGWGNFTRLGDRLHAESWRAWRDQGMDPFRIALDFAHDVGLEFHASYRPAGFHWDALYDQWNGGLYEQRPDLRGTDRRGRQTPRLSYAYPETRQFAVDFLSEVARYPVDGICILFNRRPPLVDYEPSLVEDFRAQYGRDPRQLDVQDPDWLAYRCHVLTQFMRELRAAMVAAAREQQRPKPIEISAIVMSGEEENLLHALDLPTWIAEGLVDTIIPYDSALLRGSLAFAPRLTQRAEGWPDRDAIDYFVGLTRGTSCKLAPNLMPRRMSPEAYRRSAAVLYEAGVDYLFFWDCAGMRDRASFAPSWDAIRRLGHREEIADWRQAGEPALTPMSRSLYCLNDWDLTYTTPG
jgi:hypothetical protein